MLLLLSLQFTAPFGSFSLGQQPHGRLVPPTVAVETTRILGSVLFGRWVYHKYASGEKVVFGKGNGEEGGVPLGLNCFPQEVAKLNDDDNYIVMVEGEIFSMDHSSPGLLFQIITTFYRA